MRLARLNGSVDAARSYFRRHWKRLLAIRQRLRANEEATHLFLAGLVGVAGGLVNLLFYLAVQLVTMLSLGQTGDLVELARNFPPWLRLVVPGIGGMAAGLVLYWGLRLAGPQGPSHMVEAVVAGDGRLRFRSAMVKALSSLLSISTGASIGREGSITQLTAALASKGGQLAGWQPYRLRLLVACGAASGMAAAYNAPVAGAVFAAQIVLGSFAMNLFAPLVFSSVVATMVSRGFFGMEPIYEAPQFNFNSVAQLPSFVVLGAGAGALGAFFLKLLRWAEDWFQKPKWPVHDRLALGGLLVGLLAMPLPEVWGNGYSVANDILHGRVEAGLVVAVFFAKLVATGISVGSGAIGGVFTPTLFLGAALGSLFGLGLHELGLAKSLPVGVFSLVGMGSVLAATVQSPLLAFIMVLEISSNYSLMPALMLGCATATVVARQLHPDSIYTEPLRRKGVETDRGGERIGEAASKTVGDLMHAPVPPLRETALFREIAGRFLTSSNNFLPVVDAEGRLLGVVALQDMKEYLKSDLEFHSVIAYDLMRPPPACLTPNQRLTDALPVLLASELRNVPVVNNHSEFRLIGAVKRADALGLLSEAISARTAARV